MIGFAVVIFNFCCLATVPMIISLICNRTDDYLIWINSSRIVNGKEIARVISNTTAIHSITNPTSECIIARVHNVYI